MALPDDYNYGKELAASIATLLLVLLISCMPTYDLAPQVIALASLAISAIFALRATRSKSRPIKYTAICILMLYFAIGVLALTPHRR